MNIPRLACMAFLGLAVPFTSQAATFSEGFEGAFPPAGWLVRNQSATIGTNPTCWNQFGAAPWAPHTGTGHAGANFNCTTGANTISGWLITPQVTGFQNGDQVSFWTRKGSPDQFPDRLQVRLCLDTTPDSCGAAGSSGALSTDVGVFTTLLVDVNPTLVTGVYPTVYTQFTVTLSGLPAGPSNGRLAFRYFVTNGGPAGANSDIISIDDVAVVGAAALSADLGITKTDGVTTATPGGSVTYTITASNAGPDPATGATVADTFPAALTCTWTCAGAGGGTCTASGSGNINDTVNLPSGGSVTYTASCTISAAATGTLSNTATVTAPAGVTDPNPGNNSATDSDTLAASADLSITKTDGVTTATPGGSVTYTIVASNAGPSNTTGATVADTFPASLTCTWTCVGAGGGTCTASGSGNINDTVNLPSGGSTTYTATCAISAAATGTLSNTATVTAPAGVTDPTPGNNSATDTDTLSAVGATVSGTKTAAGTFAVGGTITYTITLTNAGPGAQADNPGNEFTDILPAQLALVSAAATSGTAVANIGTNTVTWNGAIPASGSVTITITATILPTAAGATVSNQGTIAFDGDGNGTNEATAQTDDPGVAGAANPTSIVVAAAPASQIPTLSTVGLLLLMMTLAVLAFPLVRRRL